MSAAEIRQLVGRHDPVIIEVGANWADVQGAESDLMAGAARFLRSSRYLYTEYSNEEWYEGQITLTELLQMLPDFDLIRRYAMDALFENKRGVRHGSSTAFSTFYPSIRL